MGKRVVSLGNNCSCDKLLYSDTPVYLTKKNLDKVQGSVDVRYVIEQLRNGYVVEAQAFEGIPNLSFSMIDSLLVINLRVK